MVRGVNWTAWWQATFIGFAAWCVIAVPAAKLRPELAGKLDAATAILAISLGAFVAALLA